MFADTIIQYNIGYSGENRYCNHIGCIHSFVAGVARLADDIIVAHGYRVKMSLRGRLPW